MVSLLLYSLWFTTIPPKPVYNLSEPYEDAVSCLAAAMHEEARGEGIRGAMAVGHVVLSRAKITPSGVILNKSKSSGNSICKVVKQKGQFTWFAKLNRIPKAPQKYIELAEDMVYTEAIGTRKDFTNGALFFAHKDVKNSWTTKFKVVYRYRSHVFYREK